MPKIEAPSMVILATVGLDAFGIGLIFPIVPRLLEDVTRASDVAPYVGAMMALYALMQFVCMPVLGELSDRIGRRPILLVSLGGAAINYVVMATAPNVALLLLGRAIAGVTSANIAVATAYLTDITPEEDRARRFGQFSAAFGAGFIVGPVLGGLLGDHWVRLPFVAAAVLNGGNLMLALFLLPETRARTWQRLDLNVLNPLQHLAWLIGRKGLLPIVGTYFLLSAAGEAYGSCWALWGFDAFRWNATWTGVSLAVFGVCQTLAQALLPGPTVRRFGERETVLFGIACASVVLVGFAFAWQGWMVFAIMPVLALAGLGTPAFQAIATLQVNESEQGRLQGVLASATSLASVFAPLGFSSLYFATRNVWPGAVWLSVFALYVPAVPLIVMSTRADRARLTAR